jgi:hypothetical protein
MCTLTSVRNNDDESRRSLLTLSFLRCLFVGVFIKPSTIPVGWKWFYYIDPVPKAFTGVAMGQFYCDSSNPLNNCPKIRPGPGMPEQYTYEYIANMLDTSVDDYGQQHQQTHRTRRTHRAC